MGCKPSKNTNSVHPTRITSSANHQSSIVQVEESPDAPSSTPEPDDQAPSSVPFYIPPSPPPSLLANELNLKLQDHAASKKNGRPSLLRQLALDSVDGPSDGSIADKPEMSLHNDQDQALLLSPRLPGQQYPAGHASPFSGFGCRSPMSSTANRMHQTDSQVEFFKMLDRKIEEGPDYVAE